jgi:hypothetical protein
MHSSRLPVKLRICGSRSGPVVGPYRAGTRTDREVRPRRGAGRVRQGTAPIDRHHGRPAATRPRRTMDRGVEEAIRQG